MWPYVCYSAEALPSSPVQSQDSSCRSDEGKICTLSLSCGSTCVTTQNHCLCPLVLLASLPMEDQPTGSQKRHLRTLSLGIQMSWDPYRTTLAFWFHSRFFSVSPVLDAGISLSVFRFVPVPRGPRLSLVLMALRDQHDMFLSVFPGSCFSWILLFSRMFVLHKLRSCFLIGLGSHEWHHKVVQHELDLLGASRSGKSPMRGRSPRSFLYPSFDIFPGLSLSSCLGAAILSWRASCRLFQVASKHPSLWSFAPELSRDRPGTLRWRFLPFAFPVALDRTRFQCVRIHLPTLTCVLDRSS